MGNKRLDYLRLLALRLVMKEEATLWLVVFVLG